MLRQCKAQALAVPKKCGTISTIATHVHTEGRAEMDDFTQTTHSFFKLLAMEFKVSLEWPKLTVLS